MLLRRFHLREQPFGVTPDPRFLFASDTHGEALAALLYGIEAGLGFVALIAKPGLGKTTLLFETLRRIDGKAKTIFLVQTPHTPADLLRAILLELGITDSGADLATLQTKLNEVLRAHAAHGQRFVLVMDEAQNLSEAVLESVRMLSNYETTRHKLIQVVLSGQPQLEQILASPQMVQLRQRISIFGRLTPLCARETVAYIHHRMQVAGCDTAESLFTASALALIARRSQGIPRNINNICFNALTLAYALERRVIDKQIVNEVIRDLGIGSWPQPSVSASQAAGSLSKHAHKLKPPAWLLAAFAVCVLLSFFAGRAVLVRPAGANVSVAQAPNKKSLTINLPIAASALGQASPVRSVTVRPGQSLSSICEEHFPGCSAQKLREIVLLNRSIDDPDDIQAGQQISLPNTLPVVEKAR